MKAVVAAFNQEKALVWAFSVITNLRVELFQALVVILRSLVCKYWPRIMFRINQKSSFCQSSVKIIQSSGSFLKSPGIMMAIFVNRAVGCGGPSRKHLQIMFVYLWTRPHILIIYNICHGQKRVGDRDLKFIVNFLSKHFSSAHFVRYKKCFNFSWVFVRAFLPFSFCWLR